MDKVLIQKQLKLLGLFFGTWVLFTGNMVMLQKVMWTFGSMFNPQVMAEVNEFRNLAFIIISVFIIRLVMY